MLNCKETLKLLLSREPFKNVQIKTERPKFQTSASWVLVLHGKELMFVCLPKSRSIETEARALALARTLLHWSERCDATRH